MKYIQWNGSPVTVREIHGYTFRRGQIHKVTDDEIALDMLTQPRDFFVESNRTAYDKQNGTKTEEPPTTNQPESQQEAE